MQTESDTTEGNGRDYEAEAREHGWIPKEEWTGPPERWTDAKSFVEKGEQIFSYVQAKNRRLMETVDSLKREVSEVKDATKGVTEFYEKALTREKAERERLISELEATRKKAITDGDGEAFDKADRKLQEIRSEPEPRESLPPATQAWLNDNTWYQTDAELRSIADGLSGLVAQENPGLKGRAFLDKLTERVQSAVPHKFKNSRREERITEGHEPKKVSNSKARTFDNLPDAAKVACARFERTIPGFTKEKYLAQYDWSEQ
jgi:hypothetical protein